MYLTAYSSLLMLCSAACFLSEDIHDYYNVAQGKITIPGVDDGEEFRLTDVRPLTSHVVCPVEVVLASSKYVP